MNRESIKVGNDRASSKRESPTPRVALIVGGVVVAIWLAWFAGMFWFPTAWAKKGLLGDSFGPLNALFTGLAFAAAGYAVYFQYQGMREQEKQSRESHAIDMFHHLLNAWQDIARETQYGHDSNGQTGTGSYAFCRMENELLGHLVQPGKTSFTDPISGRTTKRSVGYLDGDSYIAKHRARREPIADGKLQSPLPVQLVQDEFRNFYEHRIGAPMGHVFRMLYELVKFIDREYAEKRISDETKERLLGTFRALLSDPEMHLLLYYGLSSFAKDDFKDLIDEYQLLAGLIDKSSEFVCHRIPELQYYPRTFAIWNTRHLKKDGVEPAMAGLVN
jgi:hypothetical protein